MANLQFVCIVVHIPNYIIVVNMIFSFFLSGKNHFDVNRKLRFYVDHKMAIFDVNEQSKVHDSVADQEHVECPEEPLSKFKVCSKETF